MIYPGSATETFEEVRRRSVAVLDDLVRKADELGLGEPPPVLERCRGKLREDGSKVLVVGGRKRGKSSFVNALVGREVLPTGTDQVFSIRPSQEEAYRLRFEDGSEKEVWAGDLTGAIDDFSFIHWIEVNAPVRFLPYGLNLVDLPGCPRVVERFLPEADAVIFVLESGKSATGEDLELIEKILDVTHNVFFVQTRLDLYDEQHWQNVRRLNQDLLERRFEEHLASTCVWPVSSTNLRTAAKKDVSHHRKLAAALQTFLSNVAGWNRVAEAMLVAVRYHEVIREAFSEQIAALTAESEQQRTELQRISAEDKQQFAEDWGPRGRKLLELRENLQRVIAVGKQSFADTLQMGGEIELAQKAKIEEIKSLTQANLVGREMPDEVVAAAMDGWARVRQEVQQRCSELLGSASVPPDSDVSSTLSSSGPRIKFEADYFTMLRGAASGIILLAAASVAVAAAGISLPPLGLVAVPILVVLVVSGLRNARKAQLKAARQELRMHLVEALQRVRRHFFDVDLSSSRFSRMDEYFGALERSVHEQVRRMVEKQSNVADVKLAYLAEAIKSDEHQRDLRIRETHEQRIQWDSAGRSVRDVMALVTEQTGDPTSSASSRALLRKLDETLLASSPLPDGKDEVPGARPHADVRILDPRPVPSSALLPDPSPLDREMVTSPNGGLDEASANPSGGLVERLERSGEQAADIRYSELKRRRAVGARLRWTLVPAILAALACSGWFVFMW